MIHFLLYFYSGPCTGGDSLNKIQGPGSLGGPGGLGGPGPPQKKRRRRKEEKMKKKKKKEKKKGKKGGKKRKSNDFALKATVFLMKSIRASLF